MDDRKPEQISEHEREVLKKLDAIGWGLFFIWIGVAVLMSFGWGVSLIGVGVIALGGQLARKYSGIPMEGFWLFVATLFVTSGLWMTRDLGKADHHWDLVPVVCIVAGVALLFSALFRRPVQRTSH